MNDMKFSIEDNLKDCTKGNYNLKDISIETFKYTKIRIFFNILKLIIEKKINEILIYNIDIFVDIFCNNMNNYKKNKKYTPVFVINITKKFDSSKFILDNNPLLFYEKIEELFYSTLIKYQQIEKIEKLVIPQIFKNDKFIFYKSMKENDNFISQKLNDIKHIFEECKSLVDSYLSKINKHADILNFNVNDAIRNIDINTSVDHIQNIIYKNVDKIQNINNTIEDNINLGVFLVKCKDIKLFIINEINNYIKALTNIIVQRYKEKYTSNLMFYNSVIVRLKKKTTKIQEIYEKEEYIKDMKKSLDFVSQDIKEINILFNCLNKLNYKFSSDDYLSYWKIINRPSKIEKIVKEVNENIKKQKNVLLEELINDESKFQSSIVDMKENVQSIKSFNDENNYLSINKFILTVQNQLALLIKESKEINYREKLFNIEISDFSILLKIQNELNLYYTFWLIYKSIKSMDERFEKKINSLNHKKIEDDFNLILKNMNKINKHANEYYKNKNSLIKKMNEKLQFFNSYVSLLISLRKPSIKDRHKNQIAQIIDEKKNIDFNNITFNELLKLNINNKITSIINICEKANKENAIEKFLYKIKNNFSKIIFQMKHEENNKIFIISNLNEILTKIEENLVLNQNLLIINIYEIYHIDIINNQNMMINANAIINTLKKSQNLFLYLSRIFILTDISKQLINESKKYKLIHSNFLNMYKVIEEDKKLEKFCTRKDTKEKLGELYNSLNFLLKSINEYLDLKREIFNRFYFLSTDDLINLISSNINDQINTYLFKIFNSIYKLVIVNGYIVSFKSQRGEELLLCNEIEIEKKEITEILLQVEKEMFFSVKKQIYENLIEYKNLIDIKEDDFLKNNEFRNSCHRKSYNHKNLSSDKFQKKSNDHYNYNSSEYFSYSSNMSRTSDMSNSSDSSYVTSPISNEKANKFYDNYNKSYHQTKDSNNNNNNNNDHHHNSKYNVEKGNRNEKYSFTQNNMRMKNYKEKDSSLHNNISYETINKKIIFCLNRNSQFVLIIKNLFWSNLVELFLKYNNLNKYKKILNEELYEYINIINKVDKKKSVLLHTLIISLVHNRDIVQELIKKKVNDCNNFNWLIQLKYFYYNKNLYVKYLNESHIYGYEYIHNDNQIILTNLINKYFISILHSYTSKLGVCSVGLAGTGKTETTKYFSKFVGKFYFVYNCSSNINFEFLKNLFFGIATNGIFFCFDEFNRISIEALSVLAQQLCNLFNAKSKKFVMNHMKKKNDHKTIIRQNKSKNNLTGVNYLNDLSLDYKNEDSKREGLHKINRINKMNTPDNINNFNNNANEHIKNNNDDEKEIYKANKSNNINNNYNKLNVNEKKSPICKKKKKLLFFEGKYININEEFNIFIIINPFYKGRSELPNNIKSLFRSFHFIKPDFFTIVQVMLYSNGYKYSKILSKKILLLFDLCEHNLSNQKHYKYDLRTVKKITYVMGKIKEDKTDDGNNNDKNGDKNGDKNDDKDDDDNDDNDDDDNDDNDDNNDDDNNDDDNNDDDNNYKCSIYHEYKFLFIAIIECIMPSIVKNDIYLFLQILKNIFYELYTYNQSLNNSRKEEKGVNLKNILSNNRNNDNSILTYLKSFYSNINDEKKKKSKKKMKEEGIQNEKIKYKEYNKDNNKKNDDSYFDTKEIINKDITNLNRSNILTKKRNHIYDIGDVSNCEILNDEVSRNKETLLCKRKEADFTKKDNCENNKIDILNNNIVNDMKNIKMNIKKRKFLHKKEIIEDYLKGMLKKKMLELNYVCTDRYITKLIQLYNMINFHTGILFLSYPLSKTTSYKILSRTINTINDREIIKTKINDYIINANVVKEKDLLGFYEEVSNKWVHGILTKKILEINTTYNNTDNYLNIIYFDCYLHSLWIENLNSVLDESKILCLSKCDIIPIYNHTHFIMETYNLKNITMATISRCGLIILNTYDLNIASYICSYINKLSNNFDIIHKHILLNLFLVFFYKSVLFICINNLFVYTFNEYYYCISFIKCLDSLLSYCTFEITDPNIKTEQFQTFITCIFIYSLIWSVGSNTYKRGRKIFNDFLCSNILKYNLKITFETLEGRIIDIRQINENNKKKKNKKKEKKNSDLSRCSFDGKEIDEQENQMDIKNVGDVKKIHPAISSDLDTSSTKNIINNHTKTTDIMDTKIIKNNNCKYANNTSNNNLQTQNDNKEKIYDGKDEEMNTINKTHIIDKDTLIKNNMCPYFSDESSCNSDIDIYNEKNKNIDKYYESLDNIYDYYIKNFQIQIVVMIRDI
ncbi:hypothetical protein PFTANZ_06013 [Plasmodium falciparum Tanzania (2000708)]|uniref:Dynein heavy chain n=1 Tax=Plasmodium falciparum Tanzania (2000708) TaxID=1036725 RepID=A0A024VXV0_PLAFA|nr:hypothetical protein PFTANZ_06013 [Plasmodium falciparum Tanzania (2000708)]